MEKNNKEWVGSGDCQQFAWINKIPLLIKSV